MKNYAHHITVSNAYRVDGEGNRVPRHVTDEDGNVIERIPVERGQDATIVEPGDDRARDNGTAASG